MHVDIRKELTQIKGGMAGVAIIGAMAVMAISAPLLAQHDPSLQTRFAFESPSVDHWLGTNHVGQDIWSQFVYGARTSLLVGFLSAIFSTCIGALLGMSAALIGGLYDRIVMRVVDAFIVIPAIIILVVLGAYFEPGVWNLIIFISLLGWQWGARIVRAQTLSLKERPHISAARSFGASPFYLTYRHIVPDLGPILLVEFVYAVRRGIFMEAGLAFLGIADPNVISWGMMIHDALQYCYMSVWRWWLIPPGVALSLTIVAITLIGYAFEPVLDPRLRSEVDAAN